MKAIGWLLWKDALAETRGAERVATLGLFAAAVLITLHFSLAPESPARPPVAAGFIWATMVFAALLELRRSFESERRDGTLEGLRASPVDPSWIWAAKTVSSLAVLSLLACVLVPVGAYVFVGRISGAPAAVGVCVLGLIGLLAWGTLFAAMVTGARAGEAILPVLLFPLLVPQTIACVRLLAHYLGATPLDGVSTGFVLLGAFDALAVGTSLVLFEYVLEE